LQECLRSTQRWFTSWSTSISGSIGLEDEEDADEGEDAEDQVEDYKTHCRSRNNIEALETGMIMSRASWLGEDSRLLL
jgi:hypothetical protein